MSDLMRQIPFGELMDRALSEYETGGTIFGVRKLFTKSVDQGLSLFGERLELPFGPAAGPHTQLAQNLIAGYVAGARFFELKTVQLLDGEDLPVSKPCILAADEGYNVEWSTELYVPQALDEYVKGWFAIKLLSREFGLGMDDGFIFNMSVGYDLEGIKTVKIDSFIEGLKNAENTDYWRACKQWALDNLIRFKYVDKFLIDSIKPEICKSITLSTLHGCPPEEIERIATYLLKEKGLHTYIKCNPTLLGYDYTRSVMDRLGFDYVAFDNHHFTADLQFEDAVPMLGRLQALAESLSLEFGVKLTNTFPVQITQEELPGEEMYMSGRALFPLSIEVANRLSKAFDGKMRISFSGGADIRNIKDIFEAGIWPITLATTLLKPGGYERLFQIAGKLSGTDDKQTEKSTTNVGQKIDLSKLQALADKSLTDRMYRKPPGRPPERKMKQQVPLIDCFAAPCRDGCPFGQDVPAYLRLAGEGRYLDALRVITQRNPLPFITGTICSHNCMNKCTREFYEGSVNIRSEKLTIARKAYEKLTGKITNVQKSIGYKADGIKTAVIGGGPAGLSAAYFLARAGCRVTIFEKKDSLGGIVQHVIPEFRINSAAIGNDIALVLAWGVEVRTGVEVTDLDALRSEGFGQIIIAVGSWNPVPFQLEGSIPLDSLEFLRKLKANPETVCIGENVVVIGGGNTAMDTARAAKRVKGVKRVSIVYRRTKRYMPADPEEYQLALDDGIEFYELRMPLSLNDGVLTCAQMKLGDPDASGRRSPVKTGGTIGVKADTVISAVGNTVDTGLLAGFGLHVDDSGKVAADIETLETDLPGVYIIGDAVRGPSTVAEAIADAAKCARAILSGTDATNSADFERYAHLNVTLGSKSIEAKKGILYCEDECVPESERCLECSSLCENCADVCPNRANISVKVNGRPQIVHLDFLCNECGNCEVFCPYSSAPYLDKLTMFIYPEDFEDSSNAGFFPMLNGLIRVRLDGKVGDYSDGSGLPDDIWLLIVECLTLFKLWLV